MIYMDRKRERASVNNAIPDPVIRVLGYRSHE